MGFFRFAISRSGGVRFTRFAGSGAVNGTGANDFVRIALIARPTLRVIFRCACASVFFLTWF